MAAARRAFVDTWREGFKAAPLPRSPGSAQSWCRAADDVTEADSGHTNSHLTSVSLQKECAKRISAGDMAPMMAPDHAHDGARSLNFYVEAVAHGTLVVGPKHSGHALLLLLHKHA